MPEVAAELGVSEEEVLEAMEVGGAYRSASLDTRPGDERESTTLERRLGANDHNFDLAEHRVVLERVLAELPERERTIVRAAVLRRHDADRDRRRGRHQPDARVAPAARTLSQLRERLQTLDA